MTWLLRTPDRGSARDAALGLQPAAYAHWRDLVASTPAMTDADLLELCRLRMAQLHGSEADLDGVSAERRAELEDWDRSPAFSRRERCALEYAEQFAVDATRITREQNDAMTAALRSGGIINFVQALQVVEADVKISSLLALDASGAA